ncbi:TlpA family protein disulfide reductase [Cognaticolwellia mytili]|uniref:TlpA family protein disulfide reductase n=1 Tax=Cognaticolwellia mytili TaxID=1888913 RepID=UPI00117D61DA|nr:thioredoxin family protein [Cognaticolwellia mytili]
MKLFYLKINWLQIKMVLVIASAIVMVNYVSAAQFSLKSLKPADTSVRIQTNDLATVTMIFQPECSWCKKQGITMAKVFEQCNDSINVALIGANGNRRQLKQTLKNYHNAIPAFIADSKFLRSIGGYQASPTTLIYDGSGELLLKKRGYVAEDKLRSALQILSQGACKI